MNYIILSPHFPTNYYNFCRALQKKKAITLGLGDEAHDSLRPELRNSLAEYYRVDNLHHYDKLVRALGYFTHRYGKIDGIDSHNEYWLETEARLREDFNIPGLKPSDLQKVTLKSEMKKIYLKAGIPVARGLLSTTFGEARQFANFVGYPLVAKPDRGMGATHTFKINDETALHKFFADKPDGNFLIEEFVSGNVISFDGLADKDGTLIFFGALQNEKGVMEVVHEDSHVYYFTLVDIPDDLIEAGMKTLKAFGVKGRFFHFEFFREHKTGKLIALEVNMRPPGGYSTDMFNYAADIDIYSTWADMVTGSPVQKNIRGRFYVCFVSRKSKYNYRINHETIMERFRPLIIFHDRVEGALSTAMGDYCYLLRTNELNEMFEVQKAIHQKI